MAAPFLLLGPALLRGQAMFWGTASLQFVPWWVYVSESLRQGVLPWWNPLNGMGAPLIANYQVAFFYPPNWLLIPAAALGGAPGVAWMYTFLAALHLAWAGIGIAWLLRRLRFPVFAQVLGGLAFALGGFIVGRLAFFSMAWSAAWTPWVIGNALRYVYPDKDAEDAKSRFHLPVGLIACMGMQLLSGHAQLTWYTLLLAAVWMTVEVWKKGMKTVLRAWGTFLLAGLAAVGLAAVQLIPTAEFLLQSQRAGAYDRDALMYSYSPWRFLTIFFPDFFGNPARGDFWGYATYWEDHTYTGLSVALLALATLWLLLRRRARQRTARWGLVLFSWLVLAVAFLFALGSNTPVYPFLFQHVPTFNMFQAPARYLIWAAVMLPVLGAVGAEHWRCPTGRGLYWFRLATMGAFAITFGAVLGLLFFPDINATFILATAVGGIWGLGFGALTLLLPVAERKNRRGLWEKAVVGCLLADLLIAGWGLNPTTGLSLYAGEAAAAQVFRDVAGDGRLFISEAEERVIKYDRFMRFEDFRPLEDWRGLREVLLPNLNLLDNVPSANNFDPLVTERYQRIYSALNEMEFEAQAAWLARMGVSAMEWVDPTMPGGVRFDAVPAASRLWWYSCAEGVPNLDDAWARLEPQLQGPPEPQRPVIVETNNPIEQGDCGTNGQAAMEIMLESPNKVVVQVENSRAGWLLLADAGYPGWHVSVDGKAAEWVPADILFRAVYLDQGLHEVTWNYAPSGVALSGLFSILVLFVISIMGRKSR